MEKADIRPKILTKQEKKLLTAILRYIRAGEPVTIAGMRGVGQDILYSALMENLRRLDLGRKILSFSLSEQTETDNILQKLEKEKKPLLVTLDLNWKTEPQGFLARLGRLREDRGPVLVIVIFSSLTALHPPLVRREKIVVRSLLYYLPHNQSDMEKILKYFERNFHFPLNRETRCLIYRLSGGNTGLAKSIFLYLLNFGKTNLKTSNLLKEETILYRLQAIADDMPEEECCRLVKGKPDNYLVKFGFWKNQKIFSPLLALYLKKKANWGDNEEASFKILSDKEAAMYNCLRRSLNSLVSRDQIAKALWAEHREDHYSDWAIDQIAHRLRLKIKKAKLPYLLLTRKKFGFSLQEK